MKRNLVLLELSCLELRSFQLFLLLSKSWSRFRFDENQEKFFPLERKKKKKKIKLNCVKKERVGLFYCMKDSLGRDGLLV